MQVYLIDTQTGSRQLLSEGVDGNLGNGHSSPPWLSADGSKLLLYSAATNLVAADVNAFADLFVHTVSTGERTILRDAPFPAGWAQPACLISPDGGHAFVTFWESTRPVSRLASLTSGTFSAAFPGLAQGLPSFSQNGQHFTLTLASFPNGSNPRIEVHDSEAWLAGGVDPVPPLWFSAIPAREPVLSADGRRVAFFHPTTYPGPIGTNTLVVADWLRNEVVLSNLVLRGTLAPPALSSDGRFVAWTSPGTYDTSLNQVWRADVASNRVELVSVAKDGATEGNGNSKYASISADGRYVAFASLGDNLVSGDANAAKDVFLRDMETGQTLLLSRTPAGEPGAGWSLQPFFSADGHSLFFLSHAPDLAAGDYNQAVDLFKVEILSGDSNPLAVIRRNVTSGQVELLWNAQPGKRYRIDFKDDLGMATWQALPGAFTGETPVAVDAQGNPHRFFRVAEAP